MGLLKGLSENIKKANDQVDSRTKASNVDGIEFYMKQKFTIIGGEKYSIYDANENPVYDVKGKITGLTFNITTSSGSPVAEIKKKIIALTPEYKISLSNGSNIEVKKKMQLLKEDFKGNIDGKDLLIKGNFSAYDFQIMLGDEVIGSVSQEILSWADAYRIRVANPTYTDAMIALVVTIDNACHSGNNND